MVLIVAFVRTFVLPLMIIVSFFLFIIEAMEQKNCESNDQREDDGGKKNI